MKSLLVVCLLAFAGTATADGEQSLFSGEVRIKGYEYMAFDVVQNIGQRKDMAVGGGYVLELNTLSNNETMTRLIDPEGNILHTANNHGPLDTPRSFQYIVCDEGPIFVSPSQRNAPHCSS